MNSRHHQHGAVLLVSLLILLVLTVVGVAGLTNTSLEERMSHNFQHDMLAFQGAESANEAIMELSNQGSSTYLDTNDHLLTALNAGLDDTTTVVAQDMDPDSLLHGASLAANSTVSWKGTTSGDLCAGESSGSQSCFSFELTTAATIAETGTTTTHIQGAELVVPNPGST